MADPNHSRNAPQINGELGSTGVDPSGGVSRRSLVHGMIATAAAVPTVALIPQAKAEARPGSRAAWDKAVAAMKKAEADYDRILDRSRAVDRAYLAEVDPYDRDYFSKYGLPFNKSADELFRTVHMELCIERAKGKRWTRRLGGFIRTSCASC